MTFPDVIFCHFLSLVMLIVLINVGSKDLILAVTGEKMTAKVASVEKTCDKALFGNLFCTPKTLKKALYSVNEKQYQLKISRESLASVGTIEITYASLMPSVARLEVARMTERRMMVMAWIAAMIIAVQLSVIFFKDRRKRRRLATEEA